MASRKALSSSATDPEPAPLFGAAACPNASPEATTTKHIFSNHLIKLFSSALLRSHQGESIQVSRLSATEGQSASTDTCVKFSSLWCGCSEFCTTMCRVFPFLNGGFPFPILEGSRGHGTKESRWCKMQPGLM